MGTLAVSDFTTEILAALGNRSSVDPQITQQRIIIALNLAQARLSRFWDFIEMSTLSTTNMSQTGNQAIDKFLPLPTATKTIHSFVLIDGNNSRKVKEKPWRLFDRKFPMPENVAPGWPSFYCRWGNNLLFFPTPIQAFVVVMRHTIWPTPFVITNLAAVSNFDNKDDIILAAATGYLWRTLGRLDMATLHENIAANLAQEARLRDSTRPDMDVSNDGMAASEGISFPYWSNPFVSSVT